MPPLTFLSMFRVEKLFRSDHFETANSTSLSIEVILLQWLQDSSWDSFKNYSQILVRVCFFLMHMHRNWYRFSFIWITLKRFVKRILFFVFVCVCFLLASDFTAAIKPNSVSDSFFFFPYVCVNNQIK